MFGINFKIIFRFLGILVLFNGLFMAIATFSSYFFHDGATAGFLKSTLINILCGFFLFYFTKNPKRGIKKREGFLIVSIGWFLMVVFGMLPFLFTGSLPFFYDAFFETMSGYTATGATVINDIESFPKSIVLWRSLTHWIGGMGIIVLAIAILPLLGIGGMQLFNAEATGIASDKLHPRISDTAKKLWLIYVILTFLNTILLYIFGMPFFDAINHAMSTMASGGFSTKNSSLAFWNHIPSIQYTTIFFMILAGSNFVLIYYFICGKFKSVFSNTEFKWYTGFIFLFTIIVFFSLINNGYYSASGDTPYGYFENSFRHALFQIVAVITTTGLVTADFTSWSPFITMLFFGLMFLGGSTGSTSGGVKVMRHLLLIKNGFLEFKRALHPNAILMVRFNNSTIDQTIVYKVLGFFIMYLLLFIIGAGVLSLLG